MEHACSEFLLLLLLLLSGYRYVSGDVVCPAIDQFVDGTQPGATCIDIAPVESCNFTCADGYTLTGDSSITCQWNGEDAYWADWESGSFPFCSNLNCTDVVAWLSPSNIDCAVSSKCYSCSVLLYLSDRSYFCVGMYRSQHV